MEAGHSSYPKFFSAYCIQESLTANKEQTHHQMVAHRSPCYGALSHLCSVKCLRMAGASAYRSHNRSYTLRLTVAEVKDSLQNVFNKR
jgi:hypothetical protein